MEKLKAYMDKHKIDEEEARENLQLFRKRFPEINIFSISAILEEGLDELREHLLAHFS